MAIRSPDPKYSESGRLGTTVAIDLCASCQVIWFDRLESLRLSPSACARAIGQRSCQPLRKVAVTS
jgi:Zn-finger nucleic acid-binding protein